MQYPTVTVNGVSVRVDRDGRYCLNDLHAAAVLNGEATESQKPSKFIRSGTIKRFVRALDARGQKSPLEQNQSLKVIRGGDSQSVWGVNENDKCRVLRRASRFTLIVANWSRGRRISVCFTELFTKKAR